MLDIGLPSHSRYLIILNMKIIKYIILLYFSISQMYLGQDSLRVDSEISIETKCQHNISFSGIKNIDCWHYN